MRRLSTEPGAWLAAAIATSIPLLWLAAPYDERAIEEACARENIGFCMAGLGRALLPAMSAVMAVLAAIAYATTVLPRERAWGRWATVAAGLLALGLSIAGLVEGAGGVRTCTNGRCVEISTASTWILLALCVVGCAAGVAYLRLAWLSRPRAPRDAPRSRR